MSLSIHLLGMGELKVGQEGFRQEDAKGDMNIRTRWTKA